MDSSTSVWSLERLVRRRIQDVLQEAMSVGTLTPPDRARVLPLPPLLLKVVVEDAVKVWETDWDHLYHPPTTSRLPSHPTQHPVFPGGIPSKKKKSPSAASRVTPFWLFATQLPTGLKGKALRDYAGQLWPSIGAEKQEEFKQEARRINSARKEDL